MREHITPTQWLSSDYAYISNQAGWVSYDEVTIGNMIEFLGDDFINLGKWEKTEWCVRTGSIQNTKGVIEKELVDALWLTVKDKILK